MQYVCTPLLFTDVEARSTELIKISIDVNPRRWSRTNTNEEAKIVSGVDSEKQLRTTAWYRS